MTEPDYQGVPLTEGPFSAPPGVRGRYITADEAHLLLLGGAARGHKLLRILFFCSLAFLAGAALFGGREQILFGGLCAAGTGALFAHLRGKVALSRRIADEPSLVEWAHPTLMCPEGDVKRYMWVYMTLHLRGGKEYEIQANVVQIDSVFSWLARSSPGIKLTGAIPPKPR